MACDELSRFGGDKGEGESSGLVTPSSIFPRQGGRRLSKEVLDTWVATRGVSLDSELGRKYGALL